MEKAKWIKEVYIELKDKFALLVVGVIMFFIIKAENLKELIISLLSMAVLIMATIIRSLVNKKKYLSIKKKDD